MHMHISIYCAEFHLIDIIDTRLRTSVLTV